MIGSMVTITVRTKRGPGIAYFGFPLWFALLLLLPVAILISPVVLLVCLVLLINPGRVISTFWGMFRALKGTEIQVDDRSRLVAIDIH